MVRSLFSLSVVALFTLTATSCIDQNMWSPAQGAGAPLEILASCDPDGMAPCPENTFICTDDNGRGKRCETQQAAQPDGGQWSCTVAGAMLECVGDRLSGQQDDTWDCIEEASGAFVCRALSFVPATDSAGGRWDCFYSDDERLVCELVGGGDGNTDESPDQEGTDEEGTPSDTSDDNNNNDDNNGQDNGTPPGDDNGQDDEHSDELLICVPGEQRSCQADAHGLCADGIDTCEPDGLAWSGCQAGQAQVDVCGNGVDEDCDGADAVCVRECQWPQDVTVEHCQSSNSWNDHVGHCNMMRPTQMGGGSGQYDACMADNSWVSCDQEELHAWCTRSIPGYSGHGGPWFEYLRNWILRHQGGDASVEYFAGGQGPGSGAAGSSDYYYFEDRESCRQFVCTTPLVLIFGHEVSVSYTPDDGRTTFDLSAEQDRSAERTDWPTAATPWLAVDLDQNGSIDSGRELFGSATVMDDGTAANGFEALGSYDDNCDGVVDGADASFPSLLVWSDHDGDRVSSPDELATLKEAGVVALELNFVIDPVCDARGNCVRETAVFEYRDANGQHATGALADVHLPLR